MHLYNHCSRTTCNIPATAASQPLQQESIGRAARLQRHGPAAGGERGAVGRGRAPSVLVVLDMEPGQVGGVPPERPVVGPHDRADVGLVAPGARLALLHGLVADVDDAGLRLEVRVRVVPAHAPAHRCERVTAGQAYESNN